RRRGVDGLSRDAPSCPGLLHLVCERRWTAAVPRRLRGCRRHAAHRARAEPQLDRLNNLGTAYFNSGRLSDAVDAYNQAFQFGDADYATWMNLGDAYYWLRNRPDQARDAYRQAVRLGREVLAEREHRGASPDPLITANVATVYARLGERDSARVMMARSLAVDSLNSRVQYQTALTQWQLGARTSAVAWLQRAVAGGYPAVWLRDSPVHRDWHEEPG